MAMTHSKALHLAEEVCVLLEAQLGPEDEGALRMKWQLADVLY